VTSGSQTVAGTVALAGQTPPVLTADTTNGGVSLICNPFSTNTCHWVARVTALEVV